MIITVDSNILLSIFAKDSLFEKSFHLLEQFNRHHYIINDCIYLELAVHFQNLELLNNALNTLEVDHVEHYEMNYEELVAAWTAYIRRKIFVCTSCGKVINPVCPLCKQKVALRQRILADFIIGGFALANSDGILTLDSQYYKNYFPQLKILA